MPPTTTATGCSSSCWRWRAGETRALTGDGHVYADPAFSPDGERIAYVSTRPSGYFNIAVRTVEEGGWAGDEMPVTADNAYPANRLYFGPWDMHFTPAWLPAAPGSTESDELLLVSNRDIPLGSGNVLRVPVAPGGIRSAVTVLLRADAVPHPAGRGERRPAFRLLVGRGARRTSSATCTSSRRRGASPTS